MIARWNVFLCEWFRFSTPSPMLSHGPRCPTFFSGSRLGFGEAGRSWFGCYRLSEGCRFDRVTPPDQHEPASDTGWLTSTGVACGGLAAFVAQIPLAGVPHVTDEVAYTLQARLFAAGQRVGPAADNASMWLMPFWSNEGPMFSPFPPGWPALLAVGEWAQLGAWVNPLIACFLPWVAYRIALAISDRRVARLAAVAMALSPGVLILAGSRMSHTSVLLGLGILAVTVLSPSPRRWLLGAAAAAYVVLARPYDAALLAGPLLLYGLPSARRDRSLAVWIGLPGVAAGLILWDNMQLTGSPWSFPMSVWYDAWQGRPGCNGLGFGDDIGCAPTLGSFGHTPAKAISLGAEAWQRFDRLLLGVSGGSVLAAVGAWRLRDKRLWLWVMLVVLGYALYWSPGRAYGARFYHPLYVVVPVMMVVPFARFRQLWVILGIAVVSLWGLSRQLPELSDSYWCVDDHLVDTLADNGITEGVVFMKAEGRRPASWPGLGVEAFQCDPMLEAGDGWGLADPATMTGGLQIRHALPDRASTVAFMEAHHPGVQAWLVVHDVADDRRQVRALGVLAPR